MNLLSHFLERAKESGEHSAKHLQDKSAARKSKSTCHECGQRSHWAGDPQWCGNRETNFTTWPDDQSFPDREDSRTIMVVERIGQYGVFSPCANLREHSVCTNSVSNFRCSLVDAHIPVSPGVTGTVHPTRSADSQEICRSVMEKFGTQCIQVRSRTGNYRHSLSFLRHWLRLVGQLQEFAGRLWSETRD